MGFGGFEASWNFKVQGNSQHLMDLETMGFLPNFPSTPFNQRTKDVCFCCLSLIISVACPFQV